MPFSVAEMYEKYMEDDPSFAQDIWEVFGGPTGIENEYYEDPQAWEKEYGMYLPTFDFSQVDLAKRKKDIGFQAAEQERDLARDASERTYIEELDKVETALKGAVGKGQDISGRTGLRMGSINTAIEDTLQQSSNKTVDLSNRLMLTNKEIENEFLQSRVDSTLDFDKSEFQAKKEFYQRTLAAIQRLTEKGAFDFYDALGGDDYTDESIPGEGEDPGVDDCLLFPHCCTGGIWDDDLCGGGADTCSDASECSCSDDCDTPYCDNGVCGCYPNPFC